MEARATINRPSVSKTFAAAVLVIAAMAVAAMGGYAVGSLTRQAAGSSSVVTVRPAPGTVLRQDNQVQAPAELPAWIQKEMAPQQVERINVDDPNFIAQYLSTPAASTNQADRSAGTQFLP